MTERRRILLVCLGLAAGVFLAYGAVGQHEFLDYDDGPYVSRNPQVFEGLNWSGVRWAFSSFHMGNWHPLTWISHMVDCELFGLAPGPHHLVNVALHALGAVLLFLALRRLSGAPVWAPAFAAAMFAFHPLRVESVAWAAERKDVLSGVLWMAALLAYAAYADRPTRRRYLLLLGVFALGLMAKTMLVTLPFVLLLLDVWPLGRWRIPGVEGRLAPVPPRRLLLEKVPLGLLAVIASVIAIAAQRAAGAVGSIGVLSPLARVGNALQSYVAYLWGTFWPSGLAYYYPHPGIGSGSAGWSVFSTLGAGVLLALLTAGACLGFRGRPFLLVGWLWYLGTLVPVIGLVQVGMQARADRYTYIPTIGIYIALAWWVGGWAAAGRGRRRLVGFGSAALVVGCLTTTWVYVGHWRNNRTLAERALSVTRDNYRAHNLLGVALQRENRLAESEAQFRRATRIKPDCSSCLVNHGTALGQLGRLEDASARFELALRVNPEQAGPLAHNGLGFVFERRGDLAGAESHLLRALELEAEYPEALNNLGVVRDRQGRPDDAARLFEQALRLYPGYSVALKNLGGILLRQGRLDEAVERFEQAIEVDPQLIEARFKLGVARVHQDRLPAAARRFEEVLQLQPEFAEAHYNLGTIQTRLGRTALAAGHFEQALRLRPDYAAARQALESIR